MARQESYKSLLSDDEHPEQQERLNHIHRLDHSNASSGQERKKKSKNRVTDAPRRPSYPAESDQQASDAAKKEKASEAAVQVEKQEALPSPSEEWAQEIPFEAAVEHLRKGDVHHAISTCFTYGSEDTLWSVLNYCNPGNTWKALPKEHARYLAFLMVRMAKGSRAEQALIWIESLLQTPELYIFSVLLRKANRYPKFCSSFPSLNFPFCLKTVMHILSPISATCALPFPISVHTFFTFN